MKDSRMESESADRLVGPPEASLLGRIAGSAWNGGRSFLMTLAGVGTLGIVLAGCSAYFLRKDPYVAAVALVVALIESGIAAFLLASKRGLFAAALSGLIESKVVCSVLGLVFDRLLAVKAEETPGERGSRLVQVVEKVPLAQAERWLDKAIAGLLRIRADSTIENGDAPSQAAGRGLVSWMRGWVYRSLLQRIKTLTLAAFRAEGAPSGGVDLPRVRTALENRIDSMVVDRLRGAVNLWTFGVVLGLPLTIAAQTYLTLAWLGK